MNSSKIIRIYTVTFLMLSSIAVSAQLCFPVKRTHAYFQPVTPGNAAKNGTTSTQRPGNYYIYVQSRKEGITVSDLWIHGVHHHVRLNKVSSPVVLPSTGLNPAATDRDNNKVLVPPTKKQVYQLIITADSISGTGNLPAKYIGKPLVMSVSYGKKQRYISKDEIIQLDPLGML